MDGVNWLLEVFIFNFNRDIYDETLTVEFCHKLRDEMNFESIELLKQHIAWDVAQAKDYFHDQRI